MDILYALASVFYGVNATFDSLQSARRIQAIMSHHDAIPGTARARVVQNYFDMLDNATQMNEHVILQSLNLLIFQETANVPPLNLSSDVLNNLSTENVWECEFSTSKMYCANIGAFHF